MVYSPKVNINGTSADELLEQNKEALRALLEAFAAVQQCAPHGRDYQTVEPEQYRLARQQHNRWLTQLDDMRKEIEQVALDILAQQ